MNISPWTMTIPSTKLAIEAVKTLDVRTIRMVFRSVSVEDPFWVDEETQCMNSAKIAANVPTITACTWTKAKLAHATDQYWEDDFSLALESNKLARVDSRDASVISKFPCERKIADRIQS